MTEEEMQKEERRMFFEAVKEQCYVDLNKKMDLPPIALSCGYNVSQSNGLKKYDIPICTYGNFSFIQAPPKSFKTFFVSLLAASYASNNCENRGQLKSFRKDEHIIHFDTEQSKYHSKIVMDRLRRMNPTLDTSSFYHTYALREIGYSSSIEFIEACLEDLEYDGKKIGFVIIDGVADLVSEANNQAESNELVQKLMTWTTRFNCHIATVIHSNFGTAKPTGHLGSLLEKKAETQIELSFDSMKGKTMASCKRSRNIPFKDFHFHLDKYNLPKYDE